MSSRFEAAMLSLFRAGATSAPAFGTEVDPPCDADASPRH